MIKSIVRLMGYSALMIMLTTSSILPQQSSSSTVITAKETRKMLASDSTIVLLDVRTQGEYDSERISNTPLFPVQSLEENISDLKKYKNNKIIVYCRSGNRSGMAVKILRQHGFNAVNMQGGIIQWKAERFPTISGSR